MEALLTTETLLALLIVIGVLFWLAYWTSFFRGTFVHVVEDQSYEKFERSFPIAETWMVGCGLIAALGLVMDEPFALPFMLLGGSSLIFLGLMDVTYSAQNGFYRLVRTSGAMRLELALHVVILVFGTVLIAYALPKVL